MKNILALLLISLSLNGLAQETLIHNITGYTATDDRSIDKFEALVFEDGKVLQAGALAELKAQFPKAMLIDGNGKVMLPGIVDGHGHMLGLGFNLLNVDVRGLKSAEATAKFVETYAKNNKSMMWIKGRGWNQEEWKVAKYPTAKDLDEVVSDRPVYLSRVDGHAAWLNTKAMELAGITRDTISPAGGEIVKDKDGNPTGVLIDNAEELVIDKIPAPTKAEMQVALNKASAHLLSLGVTSMHDAGVDFDTYNLYIENAQSNTLKTRIYGMLSATDPKLEYMLKQGYVEDKHDFLSIRSVKIYGDGALGSRGAALLAPYHDDEQNTGLLVTSPERLSPLFDDILAHRFQINIHAIGDRANRIALDEFERVFAAKNVKEIDGNALRHRVEHSQVISPEDIPRFKTLNIIPSMQPTHATSDKHMAPKRIGEHRLEGAYAWQTLLKQGSIIVSGSDFPVELANPFYGIHAAVTRQDRNNQPEGGWRPEERMTIAQAMRSFTIDAAYGAHQEAKLGSLTPGKWADFILVDQDVFTIPSEALWRTKVLETWIGGKKLYSAAN